MLSQAEKRFVQEQLGAFGCSDLETELYLTALANGPSSVQGLAQRTNANRVTVHSASNQLIRKGLLFETRSGKRRLIAAVEPDDLFRLVNIKQNELEQMQRNLAYAVGLLRREHTEDTQRPSVQFYEGNEGFKRMLEMSLSAKGDFLGLIDVELFSRHLSPEYLADFFERRATKGISSRLIWPEEGAFGRQMLESTKDYKMNVRLLPKDKSWQSGFISWNNCISLKSFSAGTITCTIIENADIVGFYRDYIFEIMWRTAIPWKAPH